MSFDAEFQTVIRFYLLYCYVICFLQPWESHALNGRSDTKPRTLTLRKRGRLGEGEGGFFASGSVLAIAVSCPLEILCFFS